MPSERWHKRWGWLTEVPAAKWFGFVLILALMGLVVWRNLSRGKNILESLLPAATPLFMVGVLLKGEAIMRPHPRLRRRLRVLSARVAYPVRMTVLRDDVPFGQDDGVVSFVRGALSFEGVRTSFRIAPADVSVPKGGFADGPLMKEENWRYGNRSDGSAWGFDVVGQAGVRVYFFPLKARGYGSIYEPLYRWLMEAPVASGETLLPPLDPLPGFVPPKEMAKKL